MACRLPLWMWGPGGTIAREAVGGTVLLQNVAPEPRRLPSCCKALSFLRALSHKVRPHLITQLSPCTLGLSPTCHTHSLRERTAAGETKRLARASQPIISGIPQRGVYFITSFSKETDPYTPKHISPEWEGGWCMKP